MMLLGSRMEYPSNPISQATNYNDTMIDNVFASLQQVKLYLLALIFQDRGMILKSAFPLSRKLSKILVILKFAWIKDFQDLETY